MRLIFRLLLALVLFYSAAATVRSNIASPVFNAVALVQFVGAAALLISGGNRRRASAQANRSSERYFYGFLTSGVVVSVLGLVVVGGPQKVLLVIGALLIACALAVSIYTSFLSFARTRGRKPDERAPQ